MEFDTEDRDPAARRRGDPSQFDPSKIPPLVDGDGDTPGPNHKTEIGRTWVSAQLAGGGPVCVKCLISRGNTTSHGDEEVGAGGVGEGEEKGNEAVPAGLLHSVMKFWVGRFAENLDIGDTPQQ